MPVGSRLPPRRQALTLSPVREDVTRALEEIRSGGADAARLLPIVYDELRKLAEARLARERPGQTLQATALVHEAYLRLLGPDALKEVRWDGRAHFFAAAAEAMRRILIDRARARAALKRGGRGGESADEVRGRAGAISLDAVADLADTDPGAMLELSAALDAFARFDPTKAELVKLRFFCGLTLEQSAGVLGISPATADRHWAFARAWLFRRVSEENHRGDEAGEGGSTH